MNIISIALKDLQILFKDRGTLLSLFLLPFLFILLFSGVRYGDTGEVRIVSLPTVDMDGGQAAHRLIENINRAGGVEVKLVEQAESRTRLAAGEFLRLLTIPAGFSADLAANRPVTLSLVNHPDAPASDTEAVQLVVDGVAQNMTLQAQVMASLRHMGEMWAAGHERQPFTAERVLAQAESQFEVADERPLVSVEEMQPGQLGNPEEPKSWGGLQSSVPSMTVLFVFLMAGTTAASIRNEKKAGSFRRLLAAPMRRVELLLGKVLATLITTLIQLAVIFGISVFVFPLLGMDGLTLGNHPLEVVLIAVLVALCATGLGVLIAALARTEGQATAYSGLLLWVMAFLGGTFFPLYLTEGFLSQIGVVAPHYWANKAFYGVLTRGQDLAGVATEIAVLAGFTALFWIIGVWRFDYD
jgi:ABC-2 type transport system permease protein